MKILVIEDDADIASNIGQYFEDKGHQLDFAYSGTQGPGIDSDDLQHIFDFSYRGQNSQGYGVGLYISKLICDYQGWRLSLVSNPEGGIIARVNFAG